MKDDFGFAMRHSPHALREGPSYEWEKHISDQVYHSLASAGDTCRILCQQHPDLLDAIAHGIHRFLGDGDVFDQVARALIEVDPEYFGCILGDVDESISRRVINKVLGE